MHTETTSLATRSVPSIHSLPIIGRSEPTDDSVCLRFAVPEALYDRYCFREGQFIALEAEIAGERLRRNYSICSSVQDYERSKTFSVGIRAIAKGRFSNWAKSHLQPGTSISVMTPDGRFVPPPQAKKDRYHLAIAGGSGITPMLSIIQTLLQREPGCRFTLVYGNRQRQSLMFFDELEDLKNRFLERLQLIYVFSEEVSESALHDGLLDQAKCERLLQTLIDPTSVDVAYLCGPEAMMLAAEAALVAAKVDRSKILLERFASGQTQTPDAASVVSTHGEAGAAGDVSSVKLRLDGKQRSIPVAREGPSILQAGLQAGMPLPYACQAGVCCTCRAKVIEGEVRMIRNYTLQADEIAQGFVLACQAHPVSDEVLLSFDER
jgi:ring-1,2-phenylacetyl-CoA epoxidase subunit PaaE